MRAPRRAPLLVPRPTARGAAPQPSLDIRAGALGQLLPEHISQLSVFGHSSCLPASAAARHPLGAMTRLRLVEIEIARMGLGTNRLSKTHEHVEFIREPVAEGVKLVDTAHTYAGGQSEETIGTALGPDGCGVSTKGGWNGARPKVLRVEIAESLRRLGTEIIGLYYLHRPDPETSLEESLGAIKEHQEAGQIRNV